MKRSFSSLESEHMTDLQESSQKSILEQSTVKKRYVTHDDVHKIIRRIAETSQMKEYNPDALIAIGGGGFPPARILRAYVNVPIYTVSVKSYDDTTDEQLDKIIVSQWLDRKLNKKRLLVVDEVDDTGATLSYVVNRLYSEGYENIATFVVHNKMKEKRYSFDKSIKQFAGETIGNDWIVYPWDAVDIDEHNRFSTSCNNERIKMSYVAYQ